MSLRRETPCDWMDECPYSAEYAGDCEYWCGADEPQDDYEIWEEEEDNTMRTIVLNENGYEERTVENELRVMQGLVGGFIEIMYLPHDILCVVNEEGKLRGLKPVAGMMWNGQLADIVAGTCVFVTEDDEGDFASLTDEQVAYLKAELDNEDRFLMAGGKVIPVLTWYDEEAC